MSGEPNAPLLGTSRLPTPEKLIALMDMDGAQGNEREELGAQGVADLLCVDTAQGLEPSLVQQRVKAYGSNLIKRKEPSTFMEILQGNLQDLIVWLILGAAVMAMIVDAFEGEELWWAAGFTTMCTVVGVIIFSTAFEYLRGRQFIRLMENVESFNVVVLRGGKMLTLRSQSVVVGDVVLLETGDVPPGDGLLIGTGDLELDESTLTGEAEYIAKNQFEDNTIFAGTTVRSGSGRMLVVCTGDMTHAGKNNSLGDEEEEEKSGLEARLEDMAEAIGYWAFVAGTAFFFITLIEFLILAAAGLWEHDLHSTKDYFSVLFDLFVAALLVLIMGIPEGLPVAISLNLVLGAKEMEKENVLVKKPNKGEIMGTVTTVCTDKTGTLTTGNMAVVAIDVCGLHFADILKLKEVVPKQVAEHIKLNLALNSTARISTTSHPLSEDSESGSNTERALLRILATMFLEDFNSIRSTNTIEWSVPFSSTRKISSIVVDLLGHSTVYSKGAPEVLLQLCTTQLDASGKVVPFSDAQKKTMLHVADSKGMRSIAIATRRLPKSFDIAQAPAGSPLQAGLPEGSPENELSFVGILCLQDPLRPEVAGAVAHCATAGVNVIMVTGDSLSTAQAVALGCGLLDRSRGDTVMQGPEFRGLVVSKDAQSSDDSNSISINQEAFDKIWPSLRVLARSSPVDKYLLVK
eukprot:gene12634-14934_t